ncbi:MAG: SDR family NAD(P)-dependent oxidoreductase [Deltaproteobacteria bacterium]|nr:SDR family NAD(P)-dependent oxidoreductase [Deltaproteobacteria bacterium]
MTKRTALVTGAGGGLGHATVERLLANGWKVFAADISKDLLRSSLHDPDVVPVVMDVTDRESIRSAYDAVASQTDRLDGIVNFAGIMGLGSLTDIPEERLARILDVNVMGTYRVNKKFFPLVEAARGRIVNISSARRTRPRCAASLRCSASKSSRFSLGPSGPTWSKASSERSPRRRAKRHGLRERFASSKGSPPNRSTLHTTRTFWPKSSRLR